MKSGRTSTKVARAMTAGFCIVVLSIPRSLVACMGSSGPVCTINPAACLKSMVLTKSVPGPVFPIPPAGTGTLVVSNNLFVICPITNNCGSTCTNVGVPVAASLTVTLIPPPPPVCPAGSPTLSATISTGANTMALPICSPFGVFNPYLVTVTVPGGTCPGLYTVVGTATVTFSDGTVLTQTGDTVICLVPEAPGQPGVPRLSLELLTPSFPRLAPGDQHVAMYRVINHDPINSVTLTALATSKQGAVRPQGGNEAQGVFAISSPFGDDFPILFNPGTNCIPLPGHPYTQSIISSPLPVLGPGQTNIIRVGIRSYGQCASGSCSESTLRIQGTFSDNTPALACASMALSVDSSVPSQSCALQVNDCNHNGIPDALDIASRRSLDRNFNAMPDECEEVIDVPFFSSVSPVNPTPAAPIQVQVAFNETFPMANVWANGISLTQTQFFGSPLWIGTIPADTRPGPQTVYFLGKDILGGLASYIAVYRVQEPLTPLRITGINLIGSSLALEWTDGGGPFVVQMKANLSSPTWTDVATTDNSAIELDVNGTTGFFRVVNLNPAPPAAPKSIGGPCGHTYLLAIGKPKYTDLKNEGQCPLTIVCVNDKGEEIAGSDAQLGAGASLDSYDATVFAACVRVRVKCEGAQDKTCKLTYSRVAP